MVFSWWFHDGLMGFYRIYPLVICDMENHHRLMGKLNYNWSASMAILNYKRVPICSMYDVFTYISGSFLGQMLVNMPCITWSRLVHGMSIKHIPWMHLGAALLKHPNVRISAVRISLHPQFGYPMIEVVQNLLRTLNIDEYITHPGVRDSRKNIKKHYPDAPCMVYLPTFTLKFTQM